MPMISPQPLCICVTPPRVQSQSTSRKTSSLRCVEWLTQSTERTKKQTRCKTSNFLDTLVFDALCSRLVARNDRNVSAFFSFLILLGVNYFLHLTEKRKKLSSLLHRYRVLNGKAITVHNYCCEFFGITINKRDIKVPVALKRIKVFV